MQKLKSVLISIEQSGQIEVDVLEHLTQDEKEIVNTLFHENLVSEALVFLEEMDADLEWQEFLEKAKVSKKQRVSLWRPLLKYAAIFAGVIATGYLVFRQNDMANQNPISETSIKLKMGNDNVKVIQEESSQQIVSTSGKVLGVQKGNRISYRVDSEIGELVYNELEIPFGKIFEVELSDGTLVHLNSGTKIKYPVKFLKIGKREIFIKGEAYFKVAKDKEHPFVVHSDEVAVEVLGTEFNFSSYDEDDEIKTVLVEGAVSMTNALRPEDNLVLVPGTKGAWNRISHVTNEEKVDVGLYTGWIKGELVFRNVSFKDMSKKLERSYNVVIENNNDLLSTKILNARFNVDIESIEDVMKSIGEVHAFNYTIKDKRIIID
ncbi:MULTISPECIES: FecR family protein [Arenibacter]|uniref:FecR family protein n=1 Tax=Arenibacter TaxID=178469 RepID=UPI001C068B37|nr:MULTISPECIES: FecR family protein [Arenibacter]MBU2904758.1 FecR domain-containing protein [Arenibacter algicola]MCK0136885.1 FecR domain-containing protein [Arenibacter sp. S6351L]